MPKYFVWLSEYPDEGSLLLEARDSRQARKQGRDKIADGERKTPLTVVEATEKQARRWERNAYAG